MDKRVPALTRVERMLSDGGFGAGVIAGLSGQYRADVSAARETQARMREKLGLPRKSVPILTDGASQQKLSKNTLPSFGLMLIPARGMMADSLADIREVYELTGGFNLCPLASLGCAAACLSRSGQSGMPAQQRAQAIRTAFMLAFPRESGLIIGAELRAALRRHGRINLRLNTTSDIRWEFVAPDMVRALTDAGVIMYDYTAWRPEHRQESADYQLTYSAKEPSHTDDDYLVSVLESGGNVAMPFAVGKGRPLPVAWNGYRVIDGDESDERRNDPRGVVVGLRAKGYEWRRPGGNAAGFIRPVS